MDKKCRKCIAVKDKKNQLLSMCELCNNYDKFEEATCNNCGEKKCHKFLLNEPCNKWSFTNIIIS